MKLPPIPIASTAAAVHHRGHQHFAERLLNRRGFLEKTSLTLGALAGSGMLTGVSRAAVLNGAASINSGRKTTTSAAPLPIPGGLQLLGPSGPLFHVFLPATGAEPSTITDFNGFVGWAAVGGMGTHTGRGGTRAYSVRIGCPLHARRVRRRGRTEPPRSLCVHMTGRIHKSR